MQVLVCVIALCFFAVGSNAFSASAAKKSAWSRSVFLKKVASATKETFAADIMNSETEKFILDAGSRIYETYRKKIRRRGKELGIDVPSAWARQPFPVKEPEPSEEGEEEAAAAEGGEAPAEEAAPAEE